MRTILLLMTLFTVNCLAQQPAAKPKQISDNSFLIEEAYNQEPGVVQHINTFTRTRGGDWLYTFTQEWPVPSIKHQFSYTFAAQRVEGHQGIGDLLLNYRYQLVDRTRVSVAPRVSLILPVGDSKRGLGSGGVGIQTNIPVSVALSDHFVTHWNAGGTFIPNAKNVLNEKAFSKSANLGQSTIWLANPRFNVMMEVVWNSYGNVTGPRQTEQSHSFLLNPGVRWAYNFKSGLQIVPGVSVPLGVGSSRGERSIFFYLSFEHPFKKVTEAHE